MKRIKSNGSNKRARPTIYDVANVAGVSPATVSNVIRGVKTVSSQNVTKVQDAIQAIGYRRDQIAADFRRGRRSFIGLIIPDFENPYYGSLVKSCEDFAKSNGYRLIAVSHHESADTEKNLVEEMIDWRVAGVITVPSTGSIAGLQALKSDSMPTVVVDRVPSDCPFDSVGINNSASSISMLQNFLKFGHRDIVVIAASIHHPNMEARLQAIIDTAAKMPEPPNIEVIRSGLDVSCATQVIAQRFEKFPLPKAIFSLFIQGTLASLREISRSGLAIPREISIAGFDDYDWMQVVDPPIAAVAQPVNQIAQTAIALLLERMNDSERELCHVKLQCNVESRGSIGPAN